MEGRKENLPLSSCEHLTWHLAEIQITAIVIYFIALYQGTNVSNFKKDFKELHLSETSPLQV